MSPKITPLYSQLQGVLSQTPPIKNVNDVIDDNTSWEQFNLILDKLKNIRNDDEYESFRITPHNDGYGTYIKLTEYRLKLGGLISRIHGDYFYHEPAPFSSSPSTIINQSQSQQQSAQAQIVMLLEFQSLIDKKLNEVEDGTEKNFLEEVKAKLSSIKSVAELIQLLIFTASTYKITVEQLFKLFS